MEKKKVKREFWIALINIMQDVWLRSLLRRQLFGSFLKKILWFRGHALKDINLSKQLMQHQAELESDGVTVMPIISQELLRRVIEHCSSATLVNPWRREEGAFKLSSRPSSTKTAHLLEPLKCPGVSELVYDENTLKIMAGIFKSKFVIDSVDIWWSFPTNEDAQEAENYHRDTDSTEFYKHFIYITDVGFDNGPTTIIPGSHLTKDFYSSKRFSDDEVESLYAGKKVMTGAAGTNFIANTLGLHKGQQPKSGVRLLMQFRFSLHGSSFRYRGSKHPFHAPWVSKYIYKDYLVE